MITFKEVKYKIVGFDKETGRISVVYDDYVQVVILDLHLTPDGLYPTGNDLDEYIRTMCPLHLVNRNIQLREGIKNEDHIMSLIEEMPTDALPAPKLPPF